MSNSSIRPISGATNLGLSGPGNYGNGGIHRIPQSSSIPGASLLGCLMSYTGHSFGGYPSVEMQFVYSTAAADWGHMCLDITHFRISFLKQWFESLFPS